MLRLHTTVPLPTFTSIAPMLLAACCLFVSIACQTNTLTPTAEYIVHVSHPGIEHSTPQEQILYQTRNAKSQRLEYYANTDSVYCSTGVCKIVSVRIIWNDLGNYLRYELDGSDDLEKAEGLPFAKEDHQRLHEILLDANSPLKDVLMEDIQNHENTESDVDVDTSATPPAYADIAVKGAAWTTYTLWHWAHSSIQEDILQRTRASATAASLQALIKDGDAEHQVFALDELRTRQHYDSESVKSVITLKADNQSKVIKAAIHYWEKAPKRILAQSFIAFYHGASAKERIIILEAIKMEQLSLETAQLDALSGQLQAADSYQAIDLIFQIMEAFNPSSSTVVTQAIPLLQHQDFLIARRAYWYLSENPATSAEQQAIIQKFENTHQHRL